MSPDPAPMPPAGATRRPLDYMVSRYDRVARFYRPLEPLFLITPRARRKAVAALALRPGDVVLEIGAGTGRNLGLLVEAVGPGGCVIGLDASPGMLAQARALVRRRGWSNVQLIQQDAARLELDRELDGVLFSLSYSVLPEPRVALARAWELMLPSARVAVMDLGLTHTPLRGALAHVAKLLDRLAPGDPYSRPWEDMRPYGPVRTERFMMGLYYVSTVQKPPRS